MNINWEMNINWGLLRQQKTILLSLIMELETAGRTDVVVALDGIINLIDAMQDEAVDDGVPEDEVFGADEKE